MSVVAAGCGQATESEPEPAAEAGSAAQAADGVPWNDAVPPGTAEHATRALEESSRHGEWVDIALPDGTMLNSWVVYPERPDPAGVMLVIHDIRGMRDLPRALGDQLAQDGFIAIVPDFLSGKGPDGGGTASLEADAVGQTIRTLTADEMTARLNAAMEYGKGLPGSSGRTGVVGFCWGGTQSFDYATAQPELNAAVVYYGNPTGSTAEAAPRDAFERISAPVIGFYGGNDARINDTLPPTTEAMEALGKPYTSHIFDGAGHGFMFNQAGSEGANLRAATGAWPLTLAFLREHLQ